MTLVQITSKFPNTKPTVVTKNVSMVEDEMSAHLIETVDLENDTLVFRIQQPPSNVQCNITAEGELTCLPDKDFYGIDTLKVQVTETGLPLSEMPYTIEHLIYINVTNVQDKTERFFLDNNETFFNEVRPKMQHIVIIDANRSSSAQVGKIILADVDGDEVFTPITRFTPLENSTFSLEKTDLSSVSLENYTMKTYRSVDIYDVAFEFSPTISGNMSLEFIAKTASKSLTPSISIDVFILENPCVNGDCFHPQLGAWACNDTVRSESFLENGYQCACTAGIG